MPDRGDITVKVSPHTQKVILEAMACWHEVYHTDVFYDPMFRRAIGPFVVSPTSPESHASIAHSTSGAQRLHPAAE